MISIVKLQDVGLENVLSRLEEKVNVAPVVSDIIEQVRCRGDEALKEYCLRFDASDLSCFEVSEEEIDAAFAEVGEEFVSILREAAQNIRAYHVNQVREGFELCREDGTVLGQKVTPIEKVGLYVPGGTAAYPSSVLMNAIPASIAGCREIVMTTPAREGKIAPVILAAAKIAGVSRIFKLGGAQAVAALAYGTQSVPKVDKIVGPGNAFVAEAKRQVFGRVAIDMIAGPSEILVVADSTARADYVAADLLSQAEHDKNASAVLVTTSEELALSVQKELEVQIPRLSREEIARTSVENNGKIILVQSLDEALDVANAIAPEHLELCIEEPMQALDKVQNAGSVFLGNYCPEALGDYFAGPNHTLPTSGTARFSSPLSVDDFVKKTQYSFVSREGLSKIADKVVTFARAEGLGAHAESVAIRKRVEKL
ncbi:MAG: histidinol dehydrogenase [Clostridia bacterium]|nr:histidinol dehydrogenase [Clostridia bacterium]